MKYFHILFTLFILHFDLYSQITQPQRYEIELDNLYEPYNIVSAGEKGLIIFKEVPKKNRGLKNFWEIILLDTMLQKIAKKEILIDKGFKFRKYNFSNNKLTMLFQDGIEHDENFLFVEFSILDLKIFSYNYENPLDIEIIEMKRKGDVVILGGNINSRSVILMYTFSDLKGFVLPGFYSERSNLLQIFTDSDDDLVRIITSERRIDNSYGINVRAFNTYGKLVFRKDLRAPEGLSFTDARIVGTKNESELLGGSFSGTTRLESSKGLFVTDLDKDLDEDIEYYYFTELDNFFNYMKEKKRNRIKKRIKRKKIKNQKLKLSYKIQVHDIIRQEDQNILIGEAYYLTFNQYDKSGHGAYPVDPKLLQLRIDNGFFDGFKFTHAVLLSFDNDGKVLWDNSFAINDLKRFSLDRHVHLAFTDDKITMLYMFDQLLKVKVIKKNKIIEKKFSNDLKLLHEEDIMKLNEEAFEGLQNWYGNVFFAYGVNKIKNRSNHVIKKNRKVFFINKIVVE